MVRVFCFRVSSLSLVVAGLAAQPLQGTRGLFAYLLPLHLEEGESSRLLLLSKTSMRRSRIQDLMSFDLADPRRKDVSGGQTS